MKRMKSVLAVLALVVALQTAARAGDMPCVVEPPPGTGQTTTQQPATSGAAAAVEPGPTVSEDAAGVGDSLYLIFVDAVSSVLAIF